jgi:cytochrome P450 family 109
MKNEFSVFDARSIDDPYPNFARARREHPVYFEPRQNAWVFSCYEDVYSILRNPKLFSSRCPVTFSDLHPGSNTILFSQDPPRHTQLRALVSRAFNTSVIESMNPWIEATAAGLVDAIEPGTKEVDIVKSFTHPLPVIVIAKILGIGEENWERFKNWSQATSGIVEAKSEKSRMKSVVAMYHFFDSEIQKRRNILGNDLISSLVSAEIEGESLTNSEIQRFLVMLLVAGNETTTSLIGNMLNILADFPDIWEKLRKDRGGISRLIDEVLRFDPPIQFINRVSTEAVELSDVKIPKGATLVANLGSANRDSNVFQNPDLFDPLRDSKRHLSFSQGIHYCIGASLSRLEAKVALNTLLDRYKSLRKVRAGVRAPSLILRGFDELNLRLAV